MATMKKVKTLDDYLKDYGYNGLLKAAQDYEKKNNPGAYQSPYASQLKDSLAAIENRKAFSYDPNSDALYQQYKNSYMRQGNLAMKDTMAQAAALTGGYGNSYAATAGNQIYQNYMLQLADKIPELYQLAASRYDTETANLYNKYNLYQNADTAAYGRHRDSVGDYNTELARLYDLANTERAYAANRYDTDYGNAYNLWRAETSDEQNARDYAEQLRQFNEQMAYKKESDATSLAEQQRQFNEQMAWNREQAANKTYSGGGGGGSVKTGSPTIDEASYKATVEDAAKELFASSKWINGSQATRDALIDDLAKHYANGDYKLETIYSWLEYLEKLQGNDSGKQTSSHRRMSGHQQ